MSLECLPEKEKDIKSDTSAITAKVQKISGDGESSGSTQVFWLLVWMVKYVYHCKSCTPDD